MRYDSNLKIKAVHLSGIHWRSNVVYAAKTDQRYQQSADKRSHLKKKIRVGVGSAQPFESPRGIHKQRFMKCIISDPGYFWFIRSIWISPARPLNSKIFAHRFDPITMWSTPLESVQIFGNFVAGVNRHIKLHELLELKILWILAEE